MYGVNGDKGGITGVRRTFTEEPGTREGYPVSPMETFTYRHELGQYRERTDYRGIRAQPSLNDVHSFAVVLYSEQPAGEFVEIAKIDNSSHEAGDIHVDRYYVNRMRPGRTSISASRPCRRPSDTFARTGGNSLF